MKILIMQSAFIGDVVLTLPLIEAVKQSSPETEIHFLTLPAYADFLRAHQAISEVIEDDKKGASRSLPGFLSLASKLRAQKYDMSLIVHRSFRSGILSRLAGIKKRYGFNTAAGRVFYTEQIRYDGNAHEVDRNLSLGAAAGFANWNGKWNMPWNADFRTGFENSSRPLVTVNPFSKWATKRWSAASWVRLINRLAPSVDIAVCGAASDRGLWEEINKGLKYETADFVGKTDFPDLAALVKSSDLLITGDSAPLHFASAFGVPSVVIFGPTIPGFGFGPYTQKSVILQTNEPCRPCSIHGPQKCPLGHHNCMEKITPDEVASAAEKLLQDVNI